MSCENNTCGTGGWNGPKPGDPSNDILLSVVPAYGGIDVIWTYPATNPFAVAYATVFRSRSADFNTAVPIAQDTDGFYFDKVEPHVTFFYWIQLVSINGTYGDIIGPESTQARSSIEQTIRDLTGMIDAGVLAQALKTQIERIPMIDLKIIDEIQDRIEGNEVLADALSQLDGVVNGAVTLLNEEVTQRQTADSALVTQITQMGAAVDDNKAAIITERTVRASQLESVASDVTILYTANQSNKAAIDLERTTRTTANEAMATQINGLLTKTGENAAAIQLEQTTRTTAVDALATQVNTMGTRVGANEAAIKTEQTTRSDALSAVATQINTLTTKVDNASAAVQTETDARVSADSALAQQITTVQSELNGNIAQVQQTMQTSINTAQGAADAAAISAGTATSTANAANNKANALGALYTVKTNVNGLIGGFGMYNDGQTVQMGFDVDAFWVGRTNADKKKPFIIMDGTTYIDDAVIYKITFSKLRSDDGSFIVQNGKLKADYIDVDNLTAKKIEINKVGSPAGISMDNTGVRVRRSTNGSIAIKIGSLM